MSVRPFLMQNTQSTLYPISFGSGFNAAVNCIAEYNGKLYIGGNFTTYNTSTTAYRIISLNLDGSVNTTFDIDFSASGGFNGIVYQIRIIGGLVWCMGTFTTYKGVTRNRAVCLNLDGTVNTTLNLGTGFNGGVWDVCVIGSNYHFAGAFNTYKGYSHPYVVRVDSSGSEVLGDSGYYFDRYTSGYALTATVYALDTDGTRLFCGGGSTANLVALESTGRLSSTFSIGTGFDQVVDCLMWDGTYLYCGGDFTTYKGSAVPNKFCYLNSSGTAPSSGFKNFNSGPDKIMLSSTGYLYLVGNFSTYDGTSYGRIMAFNPFYETPVTAFMTNSGTGYAHQMLDIIEAGGRLYVVGYYPSSYNGVTNYVYGISRLYMDLTKDF